jgi:hypothetical protein
MLETSEGFVEIDGFKIPRGKAREYRRIKEKMAEEAVRFFQTFCEVVKRESLPDMTGPGVVGYAPDGEELARISLDPFELSAMNVAWQRRRIREYILASNGYEEDDYQALVSEFSERQKNRKEQGR